MEGHLGMSHRACLPVLLLFVLAGTGVGELCCDMNELAREGKHALQIADSVSDVFCSLRCCGCHWVVPCASRPFVFSPTCWNESSFWAWTGCETGPVFTSEMKPEVNNLARKSRQDSNI